MTKVSSKMIKHVFGLYYKSFGIVMLKVGLYSRNLRVVKLIIGLHHGLQNNNHRSLRVVKLVMELHHGSPRVVKLESRLHHRCLGSDQDVLQGW